MAGCCLGENQWIIVGKASFLQYYRSRCHSWRWRLSDGVVLTVTWSELSFPHPQCWRSILWTKRHSSLGADHKPFEIQGPGYIVHHLPGQPHAINTLNEMLLSVWAWFGDVSFDSYTFCQRVTKWTTKFTNGPTPYLSKRKPQDIKWIALQFHKRWIWWAAIKSTQGLHKGLGTSQPIWVFLAVSPL